MKELKYEIYWEIKRPVKWEGIEVVNAEDDRHALYKARTNVSRRFKIEMLHINIKKIEKI